MKKIFLVSLLGFSCVSLIFLFFSKSTVATQEGYLAQEEYVPDELLIKFKKNVHFYLIQNAIDSIQGKIITYLGKKISPFEWNPAELSRRSFPLDPDLVHIKVPETIGAEMAIFILKQNPIVDYAEKNFIYRLLIEPDDEKFPQQWGLKNDNDTDIDADEAWDLFRGSPNFVVAVIDTGVQYNHVDLMNNIWTNPGEIPGDEIDNDGNGYIDDVHGYDFGNNDSNPSDIEGHGTHVAGIIGAMTDTNCQGGICEGVAGINWNIKIMVLKVRCEPEGGYPYMPVSAIIQAIDYATINGAYLSNNSYGGLGYSTPLYDAIMRAMNAGKLFIAAAGNNPPYPELDNEKIPFYPASYDIDNIISVSATNIYDNLWSGSHYGFISVDLGAPGEGIWSTYIYNNYSWLTGTSMASPHVAGVAALLWGYRPALSWWQAKTVILKSVEQKLSLFGKVNTGGRLNAKNALVHPTSNLPAAPSNLRITQSGCDWLKLTWNDNSNNEQGFIIYRKTGYVFAEFDRVGPNVTTYIDTELFCGHAFSYCVRAYNQDGDSLRSLAATGKTLPCYNCD